MQYRAVLGKRASEIEEATDGRIALASAIGRRPDLVITEANLPFLDGYSLCRLLRHDAATRSVPIVIVTADADSDHQARARAAGADTMLVKPCVPDRLIAEIQRVLDRPNNPDLMAAAAISKGIEAVDRAGALVAQAKAVQKHLHQTLSRPRPRLSTVAPPFEVPAPRCPCCDSRLAYERSFVGGVNDRTMEQWDYYNCADGCGRFQYRHRTKKLRKVED